ncbi:hypothetical protein SLEP1_g52385 [Rubroshorea leprosula]|uniref:Uncharacterized protein n=1 Tax=Rubroshorea leprosula TaxID=152421 RepID=A0AAV5M8D9_9ROSI|nr:hypothetical protein SLEP1_g52385 [Rubroshorea leprosula]
MSPPLTVVAPFLPHEIPFYCSSKTQKETPKTRPKINKRPPTSAFCSIYIHKQ